MAIERINPDLCNGCRLCINSCPMDVIRLDEESNKAVCKYPEDCMCCYICELECPEDAIYVSPVRHVPLLVSW
ncbi:MAG TPA: ferredoxin family protein [Dehalococcoidia bacterium]|nr:ferredoxin family protein [Dehalococcoidia bacterium]